MKKNWRFGFALPTLLLVANFVPQVAFAQSKADMTEIFGPVMGTFMDIFAYLAGVAGVVLNTTVYYTIVRMADFVNGLPAIDLAWHVLRDVGNMVLIFGFLAIGICTILNVDWYGGGTKMLPMLLVAAVFLNFSLFISKAVIDGGNIFATQFYTQINGGQAITPEQAISDGIASKVMDSIGLATLYNINDGQGTNFTDDFWSKTTFISILGILLLITIMFVFFSLAFILIARFVKLIYLMIVAPLGFAGLAVPKLEGLAKKWWSELFQQTITAPVLLLMLYIALQVMTSPQFLSLLGAGSNATAVSNSYTTLAGSSDAAEIQVLGGLLLSFAVAIGLLLGCTMLAKSMSAFGADWATGTAGKLTAGIIGYGVIGGTGMFARGVVGGGVGGALKGFSRVTGGRTSRVLYSSGNFLANRTYDARNLGKVAGLRTASAFAGNTIKAGLGAAGAGALASGYGQGTSSTANTRIDSIVNAPKKVTEAIRNQQLEYEAMQAKKKKKDTLATGTPADIQKELKKMSTDEISELDGIRNGVDRLVHNLTPSAFAELMKSKKLTQLEKDAVQKTWNDQFATSTSSAAALSRMSEDERVALGGKVLTDPNVYQNLNADDFDNIRSAKLSPTEKATISTYVQGVVNGTIPASIALQRDLSAATANPKFKAYYSIP